MNKHQIIEQYNSFLKDHKLKPEEFVLGAGGACLMHGLREETEDMDMGLKKSLYTTMVNGGKYSVTHFRGFGVLYYNKYIDLHPEEEGDTVMIDGVCCWTLKRVLDFKLMLNRPKDQDDIAKLIKALGL